MLYRDKFNWPPYRGTWGAFHENCVVECSIGIGCAGTIGVNTLSTSQTPRWRFWHAWGHDVGDSGMHVMFNCYDCNATQSSSRTMRQGMWGGAIKFYASRCMYLKM